MPALDEFLALSLIEHGSQLSSLDRAVLLAARLGEMPTNVAADLPLDQRDRLLVDARIAAFGSMISFYAGCPRCSEGNEAGFDLRMLPQPVAEAEVHCDVAGQKLALRAPTSRTVGVAVMAGDHGALLRDCGCGTLEPELAEEAESALEQAFPLLDLRLEMVCSACEAEFCTRFDIVAWIWREIETLASRAIDTVDRLARAYGWNEREILGLSPGRRALYLAKVMA